MRTESYAKWLFLSIAAVISAPVACGDSSSSTSTSASSSSGAGGSSSSSDGGSGPSTVGSGGAGGGGGAGGSSASPWPEVKSAIDKDPAIEQAIDDLLAKMSLEQKIGQMIQPEIAAVTPAEVKEYHLGSVLNGGGAWPGNDKYSTAQDWIDLADAYYNASVDTSGGDLGIPIIWGTDALHGQNKLIGATLFPHNIGLGAANNPDLMEEIGIATAKEVAVTGLDWTFAPCLAVVRDDRWGRTYESYSEEGAIVKGLGGRIVTGLQGAPTNSADLLSDAHILSTAKHFIGDGGTNLGVDQGDNLATEQELADIHAQGYLSALAAGAQTVMASYNSWQGKKLHGHKYLLTDILKGRFNFDGLVVGDWNGHAQIPGCAPNHCPDAINAGVDILMTPYAPDWKELHANTVKDVKDSKIPIERVDDAVRRVLRVKMRFGLLGPKTTKGAPSTRDLAGKTELIGAPEHRALARKAVRESLVLLKNKNGILPLDKTKSYFVAGKTASNIGNQAGGWTLDWQGATNVDADFPGATSVYAGISAALTISANAVLSPEGDGAAGGAYSAAIVVIGETPYAEFMGDIGKTDVLSMEHALLHPEDLAVIEKIRADAPGLPIVTVFISGRPLYVNKELNRSDAFVAAWLPGSEGGGIADVLFGDFDFTGKLSFSWPAADCQVPINKGDGQTPLFALGFGLKFADNDMLEDNLPEMSTAGGCGPKSP